MKGQLAALGMPPYVVEHVATTAGLHQDNRYDRFSNAERLTGIGPDKRSGIRAEERACVRTDRASSTAE
ncbi:hypothetical protein IVB22_15320 [Bradyrhizobium sp. 190]|uniref:hypothetical protein n=1 Tax=Bradyrhizobium sp. 190 TaxID=2782658 RepID=UPI001FF99C9E|nr:hypothetical protein [Bradyrhizobium sp. 190]MCK1513910.1 hypothetical protein [Bradyrhizobium sp. 190]